MSHSYEELRRVALDILAGHERGSYGCNQYEHFKISVAEVLATRASGARVENARLDSADSELFLELFWSLFREGVITLGYNDSNREFPFFRVSSFGRKLLEGSDGGYFFHDVSSYEILIRTRIPTIDAVTLLYLKEAMQAFKSACLLSASVMVGVATEHSFLLLLEKIQNSGHASTFRKVFTERGILRQVNLFKRVLDSNLDVLPPRTKEDLDTQFVTILSMIRTFRNESGHPSGRIIKREQCFVLLQLFIPCCEKMYQIMDAFGEMPKDEGRAKK